MADIPDLPHINILTHLERAVHAHELVHEGIATHAEKHRDAQHQAREAAARARKLLEGAETARAGVPSLPGSRHPGRARALAGDVFGIALATGRCYGDHAGHHARTRHRPGRHRPACPDREGDLPMTAVIAAPIVRGIACSFGCGNESSFVLVDIASSDTSFLCVPCFLHVAENMAEAMLNPDNGMVKQAQSEAPMPEQSAIKLPGEAVRHTTMPDGTTYTTCADCEAPDYAEHEVGCIFGGQ